MNEGEVGVRYFTNNTFDSTDDKSVNSKSTSVAPANDNKKLSKKQLKKLAKFGGKKEKKEKPKWNLNAKAEKNKATKTVLVDDAEKKEVDELLKQLKAIESKGGKKPIKSSQMRGTYNVDLVEACWDKWWEKQGFYTASAEECKDLAPEDKFVMVIPPPNVTGTLHIGHALMCTIEDVLARYNRMLGKKVLWVPGYDHAGIATQAAVEAKLWKEEQKTRHDFEREVFIDKVKAFKEEKGGKIIEQMRRMGVSTDHSRMAYTMDDVRSRAVNTAFVKMYEKGLIYRKTRLVNWSSQLRTAISDIEVDKKELEGRTLLKVKGHDPKKKYEFGVLTEFSYLVVNEQGEPLKSTNNTPVSGPFKGFEVVTVATTRLETMLADTGVAIHPEDKRYLHLHGKFVLHPFFPRVIPIVLDSDLVDMAFGTAVVKVTPAHDEHDYACGEKHSLPMINMLDDDGRIDVTECVQDGNTIHDFKSRSGVDLKFDGEKYHGMMRYDARKQIELDLEELGLLGEKKDNKMVLPICSRSGDIIEPKLKEQWWVDTTEMARRSVDAVRNGDLKLVPEFHKDTWYRFLEDPHQWCISRQLWWGHRIPAFKLTLKTQESTWIVAETPELAHQKAKEMAGGSEFTLEQDEDVLDTWFSSGLFPFSCFNWPEDTDELKAFFPNSLLETGHDILFFWVARMVMMSYTLMDCLPFDTVYLHPIVRDKFGRKMSKSLGNIIDPLAVINGATLKALKDTLLAGNLPLKEIEKASAEQAREYPEGMPQCGSDALRFGLLSNISGGRDVNLDVNNIFSTRKFCNKLWQVTRFSLMICGDEFIPKGDLFTTESLNKLAARDQWILNELFELIQSVNKSMKTYAFHEVTAALMNFWTSKLCDVYVEAIKPVVKNADSGVISKETLLFALDAGLRLLHPIMPFVTEELWQNLPQQKCAESTSCESIMIAQFPTVESGFVPEEICENSDFKKGVETFEVCTNIAQAMRSLKGDYSISKKDVQFHVFVDSERLVQLKESSAVMDMQTLGNGVVSVYEEKEATDGKFKGCATAVVDGHLQVMMELKGNIDVAQRLKKLNKEYESFEKSQKGMESKLKNKTFLDKAPQQVLKETQDKLTETIEKKEKVAVQIQMFKDLE